MASVKIVLFTSKILKNNEHPLMIRIIKDRKISYRALGISCRKDWWDSKENKPNRKHPNRIELEALISKKVSEANKLILNLENEEKTYSAEEIAEKSKNKFIRVGVFVYFNELIERFKKANRIGNANAYLDAKRALFKFLEGKDISFQELNVVLLNKFEESLCSRHVTENSISVYMRAIRALYNKAIEEGIAKKENYPFNKYKISKLNTKTKKRSLTKEQINKIIELQLEEGSKLWDSKNYFLFCFYNMGINFVDIAKLIWSENIENGRLKYIRSKTGKHYNIKLLSPAIDILNYYKNLNPGSNYIFPILDENKHITATQIDNRIDKVIKRVNKDLKEIAKLAKIDFNITFYVARHSFATILKRSGVSTSVISEAMKHDTERTTQVYLDSFENSILDDANQNLLN